MFTSTSGIVIAQPRSLLPGAPGVPASSARADETFHLLATRGGYATHKRLRNAPAPPAGVISVVSSLFQLYDPAVGLF
jgi:hypothetical protein